MEEWTRRTFIQQTLGAGGALALGLSCARPESDPDPFASGELLENLSFPRRQRTAANGRWTRRAVPRRSDRAHARHPDHPQ